MGDPAAVPELRRRTAATREELIRRIQAARVELADLIRTQSRDPRYARSKAARERLFGRVSGVYDRLAVELDAWLAEIVAADAKVWHEQAVDDMTTAGASLSRAAEVFSGERVRRYWELINTGNKGGLAAVFTKQMAARDIAALRASFLDVFRQGQVSAWTTRELQKNLQARWDKAAGNMESRRFVDAAGKKWTNAQYLQMLTRTTLARVARESYIDTLTGAGFDLARIVGLGESCPICSAWIGLIVSMSGANKRYPAYRESVAAGMWHPNCDCLLEYVDEDIDATDIRRQSKTPNPSSWADAEIVAQYNRDATGRAGEGASRG